MVHAFDSRVAEEYGIKEAILLSNFEWWIKKNELDERNFYEGYYWTYCTLDALAGLYPYMSKKTIQRTIDHLVKEGLLIKGNFNAVRYDHTTWYALTEKYYSLWSDRGARCSQTDHIEPDKVTTPIPDSNTDSNTNIHSAFDQNELFEKLWKLYPRKQGKGQVSPASKKRLADIGEEHMIRAIERYKKGLEAEPWRKAQNGSTFFNSGYVDYLDENYEEIKPQPQEKTGKSNVYVPEPPKYQKFEKEEWEDRKGEAMPDSIRNKLKTMFGNVGT